MRRLFALGLSLLFAGVACAAQAVTPQLQLLLFNQVKNYIGFVTTRSRLPNNFSGGASFSQMSLSYHIVRANSSGVPKLAIDIPTYFVKHSNQQETATGGTWQFRASVEYPPGNCSPLAYDGSGNTPTFVGALTALQTVPDNSDNWFSTTKSFPNGARIGIRIFGTAGPGIINYSPSAAGSTVTYQGGEDLINGERFKASNTGSTTDQTATCDAITDNGVSGASGFGPAAIVGPTTAPSFYIWGDSREEGIADFYNNSSTNIGQSARSIGPYFAYVNGGITSLQGANWITGVGTAHQIVLSKLGSHLLSEVGVNDIAATLSAATAIANNKTAWAQFGATRIIVALLAPETTSTDAFQGQGNQTALSYSSTIDAYNALVRAGVAGAMGIVDYSTAARDTINTDKWTNTPTSLLVTASFTATCAAKVLTVTAVASGALRPLDTINGVNVPGGTSIISQATGTTGSTGTYNISNTCTVGAGESMSSNQFTTDGTHQTGAGNQTYNLLGVFNAGSIHYPFLLKRDLDPAANDNAPAFMDMTG